MLRVALVGCSASIASRYLQAVRRFRDIKIVATCHEDAHARAVATQLAPSIATYSDLDSMLSQSASQFDAAIIESSIDRRAHDANMASAAGKHLLIASPLARTSALAQEIATECTKRSVLAMIAGTVRMRPGFMVMKQTLDAGKLGLPALLRTQAWRSRGILPDDQFAIVIERLDLMRWIFRSLPTDLLAISPKLEQSASLPTEMMQLQCGFPGDGMALFSLTNALRSDSAYNCSTLIGSAGAAYWDDADQAQLVFREGNSQCLFTDEGIGQTVNELREFRDMIAGNRQSTSPLEEGVTALVLAEAAKNSARTSQPFELHLADSTPIYKSRGEEPTESKASITLPDTKTRSAEERPSIRVAPESNGDSVFRVAVLSVIKHDYVARGVASHPRFELVVVADDPGVPDWVHQRNQQFADEKGIPYVRNVEQALKEYGVHVAVVSTEAERHCGMSEHAANLGIHVIQDKPMSNRLSACDSLVAAVERNGITFSMWNRNMLPAVLQATEIVRSGTLGKLLSINADFYFSKDAGPPKGSKKPHDPLIDWLEFQKAAHVDGSDGAVGKSPMGELQNEGIYPLAYIHQITGDRFLRAYAKTASAFHQVNVDNGVEDLGTVTLTMSSGMIATLAIGRIGASSHPDLGEIKLWIVGSEGSAVIAEARPEVAIHYRGQSEKEFRRRRVAIDNDFLIMDNFARAVDGQGSTILDVRTSRHITAAIQAALRSARSGRFEFID